MAARPMDGYQADQSGGGGRTQEGGLEEVPGAHRGAYMPVTADTVKCVTFKWARACPVYSLQGASVTHNGEGMCPYRPVYGDLAMPPKTGKYYYEFRVNTDNCRIGVATRSAYPTDESLEKCALGEGVALSVQTPKDGSYLQTIGAAPAPERAVVAYMDGQTSKVYVNGVEQKMLWRLFVPSSGALLSFVVDTEEGVVQLFVNKKYAGLVFGPSAGLKGETIYPVVGIAGFDMNNRNIGKGNLGAAVSQAHKFDCLYF